MEIGSVRLENNIFLAPMAGVTDQPFRILCREQGCGLVYSEMVSAKGMYYNNENTNALLRISEHERPTAIQIFGREPELMADMAARLPEQCEIVDINMGCPAPKIVRNGEGSALMNEPELVGKIVYAVSRATDRPVTVKIRKGFDRLNAVEIAKIAEDSGAAAVAVHGRTRSQYYSGQADWEVIARVREALSIPVIGNGDVVNELSAERMIRETGVAAIMIGRAAQGNPWIFGRIRHYFETGEIMQPLPKQERIATAIRHGRMLVEYKGEYVGVREMRKQLAWYLKGMEGAARMRVEINKADSLAKLENILEDFWF
jgi:nifR3 family TIM-barrel protein